MDMKRPSYVFLALALVGLVHVASAQNSYVVLDSLGWTIPPAGSVAYTTWAANKTFNVGDILEFNFTTGEHDVAKVTKDAYDNCNGANPISMNTAGPVNITLDAAGEHYFICTIGRHCSIGQKLAINVSGSSSSSPSPSPTPTPTPATPTTPASAPTPTTPASAPTPTTPASAPTPTTPASAPTPTTPASAPTPPATATPPASTATPPSSVIVPPSATTTPTGTTPAAPPPEDSSAKSIGITGFSATILSIAVALLF